MLNRQEQEVVQSCKEWGFGAYLQWVFIEYEDFLNEIGKGNYPNPERLRQFNERMADKRAAFDFVYFDCLPERKANPLAVEQEAWKLLSPRVKQQIEEFGQFVENYSPSACDKEQLLTHLDASFGWIQKWNIISNSYKAKYSRNWTVTEERELEVKELIRELLQEQVQS